VNFWVCKMWFVTKFREGLTFYAFRSVYYVVSAWFSMSKVERWKLWNDNDEKKNLIVIK